MPFPKRLTSLLLLVCAGCATTPSTPAAQGPAAAAPPAAQAPAPGAGLTVRQALAREVDGRNPGASMAPPRVCSRASFV